MKLTAFWERVTRKRKNSKKAVTRDDTDFQTMSGSPTVIPRNEHALTRKDMSEHALKVLYRLKKSEICQLFSRRRRARFTVRDAA